MTDVDKLLNPAQLGKIVGVTATTVRRWVRRKLIPVIRPTSRTLRFRLPDVMTALTQPSSR